MTCPHLLQRPGRSQAEELKRRDNRSPGAKPQPSIATILYSQQRALNVAVPPHRSCSVMEHDLLSQLPREILKSLSVAGALAVIIEQILNFPGKIRAAGSSEGSCGLFISLSYSHGLNCILIGCAIARAGGCSILATTSAKARVSKVEVGSWL